MWFSEYGLAPPSRGATFEDGAGHYTAMVWKSTTKLGCGSCGAHGTYVCHYAQSPPNFGGQFILNVPPFQGSESQFRGAGIDPEEAKRMLERIKGFGLSIGDS